MVIYKVSYMTNLKADRIAKRVHLSTDMETTHCGLKISDRWWNYGDTSALLVNCPHCQRKLS